MSYGVQLDVFRGPIDLLLYLVRKQELDIGVLPLAKITTQFSEMMTALEVLDLDLAAEFLVTATTLAEYKSQYVLPRTDAVEEELEPADEGAVDSQLVARLVEYKRFKDASRVLEERAAAAAERFARIPRSVERGPRDMSQDRIRDVELWDLLSAFARVVKSQLTTDETKLREQEIPVHIYVDRVGNEIRQNGEVSFFKLFAEKRTRGPIVGIFLSILELVRHHGFRAEQDELFGDIVLRPPLADHDDGETVARSATADETRGDEPTEGETGLDGPLTVEPPESGAGSSDHAADDV